MKLNYFTQTFAIAGRWVTTTVLCLVAIAFVWQGAGFSSGTAVAAPNSSLIATVDAGSKIQGKVSEDAGRTKNFVRDAAEQVKETANSNASRVERATGNDGSFIERKAQRDTARIEKRANEDAARTQEAIDTTKNVVERAVDGIKDAFGN